MEAAVAVWESAMIEEQLFNEALSKPAADRAGFLAAACAGDSALRRRLEIMVTTHDQPGSFLQQPATPVGFYCPIQDNSGTLIGSYKLLEPIGEGGMGAVWMAQQSQPVKRLVALKLIKPGMDSKQVPARFDAERQALALMDHPNIAKVHDAGTTADGRPYFVMELVKGVPITKYCDENCLTPTQRLQLFLPVCQAIQHAHQKGIIHRDVKPSNVLVALYDDRPVPKVIDFGVAKATGQQLTEETLHTGFGAVVGTVEYMSPEQASFNQLDVDTRSDIYSLGVLLYELLTGSPPFTRKDLEHVGVMEMLRVIREEEPSKPSTKLSSSQALPSLSANRGTEASRLPKLVRGELDWIVMKALEKDRNRRYETANGFAADVQRFLSDEPVQACPPSARYRLRKFARRNKAVLGIAASLVLAFVVLVGGLGWVARDRAARQAKAAHDFEQALDRAESFEGQGKQVAALAALDRAEVLAGEVSHNPSRIARLAALKERLDAEARDQAFVGEFETIRLQVASQVDVAQGRFLHESVFPEIRDALGRYGITIGVTAPAQTAALIQSRPERVRQDLIAALDECLRRAKVEDAPMRQWLGAAIAAADNDAWRTRVRQAEADHDWQTLDALVRAADERKQPPSFLLGVANGLPAQMRAAQLDLLRRIQRAYPADLWANSWLGSVLVSTHGQPAEAIRYFTAAVALQPNSPGTYVNRGGALIVVKEFDAAIADFRQALTLAPQYGKAHYNLALALMLKGQVDEAIEKYRNAIAFNQDDDRAHYNLGLVLNRKGQMDAAIGEFREAIRIQKDKAEAHCELGKTLQQRGEFREALEALRRGHELGSKDPRWRYDSAKWVQQCERQVELEGMLPAFLLGNATPTGAGELVELAGLCSIKNLNRAAARFYEDAFAAQPSLGDSLNHRFKAAGAAALAGCGQGKDAGDESDRTRLRNQALIWLREDLAAWKRMADMTSDQTNSTTNAIKHYQLCLASRDFAGVRGAEALSKLPEGERQSWQQLWSDMADTLAQSQGKSAPIKSPETK